MCLVTVMTPGQSDGSEDGLGPAHPDGAVPAQARADVQALHPQGDDPESHGCQHRRGALMSQQHSGYDDVIISGLELEGQEYT